jgi:hypothetical protein
VTWRSKPPNGQGKECRYGWLFYRRVKTQRQFHRPMNRVVHAHLKSIRPEKPQPWVLKDLRKTAATYYDEHMPESSIEILGHSVGGVTYQRYAHRDPLAFKAIMTLPQPTAFTALHHGFDGECPCCSRKFRQA